ncbi:MAG: sulfatase-like hydrolase/transferase [Opitutales bacterium]
MSGLSSLPVDRPNLILITTDQQRADCVGYAGETCVRTPHLDMLAKESRTFSRAYVDCPVCIPARTTLITGRQAHHNGCPSYQADHRIDHPRADFLGSLLTDAGYQTCLIGKTHWHTDSTFTAGFEQHLSFGRMRREMSRHLPLPPSPGVGANELSAGLSTVPPQWQSSAWAVTEALEFLQARDRSRPFCLWVSLIDPHPPNVIHEPYFSLYNHDDIPAPVMGNWSFAPEEMPYALQRLHIGNDHGAPSKAAIRQARGVYYGMITHLDAQLGRLFGALMRHGLWSDTAIAFSSDHGEMLFDHGFGFKGNLLEASARVPFLLRLPHARGGPRGASTDTLVQWADLLPTFCELAEARVPENVDGCSLVALLEGREESVRDNLHCQIDNQHAWQEGAHKYLYFADDGRELVFEPARDPLDQHSLHADTALTERLRQRFIEHLRSENHPHLLDDGSLLNLNRRLTEADRLNCLPWMGLSALD